MKQTENAMPTKANDLDRVKGVVTSEIIALSSSEIESQSYQYFLPREKGRQDSSGANLL